MENEKVSRKDEMESLNKQQAVFYDTPAAQRKLNIIMKTWRILRRRMYYLMEHSGIWQDLYTLQKQWIGPLAGKKVLDFGCFSGNTLSYYLASNAGSYLGIDLSQEALKQLDDYFKRKGVANARVQCVDILSKDFTETGFDIIYAQGVLHHFMPIDIVLQVLQDKLAPKGRIVTLDPMQTSLLTRSVRAIYHPFRIDREWEWPFTRDTFTCIGNYFQITHLQGAMGLSKWAIPLVFCNKAFAVRMAQYLHGKDMLSATSQQSFLWGCMQIAMCLEHGQKDG
ncbi:class I SAM-dependent methyltransferase [Desulfobulbus rhabdoformis]|uniref:class I SAM-dependent methyltransferase n=1 Tax=Desulfobulbus rhabdoformis TaxID=34032 RepID=UPI001963E1D5|nr:class I SAM-dependent methyltransferase [Desulfobulbus rhabdoformis]MBM9616709.1 class I SAM-dependent methyltransferase [Desulfobulbus rhabdoformis]